MPGTPDIATDALNETDLPQQIKDPLGAVIHRLCDNFSQLMVNYPTDRIMFCEFLVACHTASVEAGKAIFDVSMFLKYLRLAQVPEDYIDELVGHYEMSIDVLRMHTFDTVYPPDLRIQLMT